MAPPRVFGREPVLQAVPLCPEIRLWLLASEVDLEQECADLDGSGVPYWAFCWGAGQALARHVLTSGDLVRDRRVVDLGAGSGVVAVAARMAGARRVTAVDTDPAARAAIAANAHANGVDVQIAADTPEQWDVLLAADVLYHPGMLGRLLELSERGLVLVADPERAGAPRLPGDPIAHVAACTVPDVDSPQRNARIYRLGVHAGALGGSR